MSDSETIVDLCDEMARKKDALLRELLDDRLPEGCTPEDVKERCGFYVTPDRIEVYLFDDIPLIQFWPVETETKNGKNGSVYLTATQQYRKLCGEGKTVPFRRFADE